MGGFAGAPDVPRRPRTRSAPVDGVDAVAPGVMMLMDDEAAGVTMGVPPMITGSVAGADEGLDDFATPLRARAGR